MLVVPSNEWRRLKKILTKKDDDKATVDEIKRLKDERQAASKAITETWTTTTVV